MRRFLSGFVAPENTAGLFLTLFSIFCTTIRLESNTDKRVTHMLFNQIQIILRGIKLCLISVMTELELEFASIC